MAWIIADVMAFAAYPLVVQGAEAPSPPVSGVQTLMYLPSTPEVTMRQQAPPQQFYVQDPDTTAYVETTPQYIDTPVQDFRAAPAEAPYSFSVPSQMVYRIQQADLGESAIMYGYIVIAVVLIEGMFALHDFIMVPEKHILFDARLIADPYFMAGLGTLGVVDLLLGAIAALALHLLWPQLFLPLCCWRALSTIVVVPTLAVMLALEPPVYSRVMIFTWVILYLASNLAFLFILSVVYRSVDVEGQLHHQQAQAQAAEARLALLRRCKGLPLPAEVPRAFGVFPLEETIAFYMLVTVVLSAWALVVMILQGNGTGAWAFFMSNKEHTTFWLEAMLFLTSLCAGVWGFSALVGHRDDRGREEYLTMAGHQGASEQRDLSKSKKRNALGVLGFFVFSILRFSLFIPVSGMTLMMADVCGLYVHGISKLPQFITVPWSWPRSVPIHCTSFDLLTLLMAINFCLLDAYLLVLTYKLWDHYQVSNAGAGTKRAAGARWLSGTVGQYGAVGAQGVIRPVPSTLQPLSYTPEPAKMMPTFGASSPTIRPAFTTLRTSEMIA